MYIFCAARDVIALGCLLVAHAAQQAARCGGGSGACAAPALPPAPPPPRHLLRWCAALGFAGVFANQLLFLKARAAHLAPPPFPPAAHAAACSLQTLRSLCPYLLIPTSLPHHRRRPAHRAWS
jgi:hypothetical protein